MQSTKARFPWRVFLGQVAAIAVPVALQNLLTTTGSMVDTMMIASLGQLSVGAVGLCAQFSSLMFSCYWGFVGGGMLFFAQYWGAKDHEGIHRSYGLTLSCMMTVGVIFAILGTLFPDTVMRLYTDKPEIQEVGVQYLRIVGLAYPLQVLSMAMAALLRSTERVRVPLYAGIASVVTNCLFNWLLIFGQLGLPRMGVRGAALATVIAAAVNVGVIYFFVWRQHIPYITAISRHFRWSRAFVTQYFRKCFPILCNELLVGLGNMVINIVLGRQSVDAIAAIAVFRTLEGLVIGFFAGFSNAASVLVGKEVGAGNLRLAYDRAKRIVYLCMGFIACTALALIALHTPILSAMSLSGESFRLGFGMLIIYGVASVIRMGNWTQNDTYRSAGDAKFGTLLEIIFMWALLIPMVWLTGMVWHTPFLIVFLCCYIDEPIRFVMMHIHLYRGTWIKPVTPEGQEALPAFRAWRRQKESRAA